MSTAVLPAAVPSEREPRPTPVKYLVLRRTACMTGVWVGIGVAVGWLTAPPGVIGVAAGVTAGLIVLTPVGVLLGLAGARWRECVAGAAVGAAVAAAYSPEWRAVAFGVLYGGLFGATVVPVCYRLPVAAVGRLKRVLSAGGDQPVPV